MEADVKKNIQYITPAYFETMVSRMVKNEFRVLEVLENGMWKIEIRRKQDD